MHRVWVLESENVQSVLRAEVSAHPFYPEVVGHLTPLDENILPTADKVSSIKGRLKLSCNELSFESQLVSLLHTLDGIVVVVQIFAQERFGARAPFRT